MQLRDLEFKRMGEWGRGRAGRGRDWGSGNGWEEETDALAWPRRDVDTQKITDVKHA